MIATSSPFVTLNLIPFRCAEVIVSILLSTTEFERDTFLHLEHLFETKRKEAGINRMPAFDAYAVVPTVEKPWFSSFMAGEYEFPSLSVALSTE